MEFVRTTTILILFLAAIVHSYSEAQASNSLYDFSKFLAEPHPFARTTKNHLPSAILSGATQAPSSSIENKIPVQIQAITTQLDPSGKRALYLTKNENCHLCFSEIRVGILKHAVSLIGNTAKETGLDGNLEFLWNAPDWLKFLWAPQPHLGFSFNGSSSNTDVAYTGLSWGKRIWRSAFLNFSFGLAIHNGKLSYNPDVPFPSDHNRHREFGCRAVFRESFEAGWVLPKEQSLSIMWSHYSHAGLCGEQNEGLDNLGVRYGYRF